MCCPKHLSKQVHQGLQDDMISLGNKSIFSLLTPILSPSLSQFSHFFLFYRIIQHSHPSCNNLMLSGIMLCLLAIIPLGKIIIKNFSSHQSFVYTHSHWSLSIKLFYVFPLKHCFKCCS